MPQFAKVTKISFWHFLKSSKCVNRKFANLQNLQLRFTECDLIVVANVGFY